MCRECGGMTRMPHNADTLEMIIHFSEVLVAKIDDNVSTSLETLNLIPIISEVSEMNAKKNAEKFMSSKEQKTPEGQARKKLSWISTKRLRQLNQTILLSRWIRAMKKLRIWKFSLQKPRLANATPCCASKRKWKTCAVVLNRISKSA
ncbi:heat shock protein GrpE [Salmonella enterica subsp. enterica]|uniref:Heat shock protein GrpE n=1 Tax=Salmonella enterica I TaxID=59201 RepID=A0A379UTI6_SALET|nr:heat shock protein GrpE [Salmonella enterica subsp. enterica]